jgi:hypothetical protein
MKRSRVTLFAIAAALVAATSASAGPLLQDDKPSLRRSEEARKNDAEIDQQFRTRRDSNDAPAAKGDPWAGVRSQPAEPVAATSAAKKATTKGSAKN